VIDCRCLAWYFYDILIIVIIFLTLSYAKIANDVMDIPIMPYGTNPLYSYGNNTLFSYPIKLSDDYCWPSTLYYCQSNPSSEMPCCKSLYDKNSSPYEEISSSGNLAINIMIPLFILLMRVFLYKYHIDKLLDRYYILVYEQGDHNLINSLQRQAIDPQQQDLTSGSRGIYDEFILIPTSLPPSERLSLNTSPKQATGIETISIRQTLLDVENPSPDRTTADETDDPKIKSTSLLSTCSRFYMKCFHNHHRGVTSSPIRLQRISSYFWVHSSWTAIIGLLLCLGYQAILVDYLKEKVSAPRPIYYSLQIFSSIHASARSDYEATSHRSWPSGHSSTAAACLGYTMLVLLCDSYELMQTGYRHGLSKALVYISLGLLLLVLYIGATRIVDYWHFAHDVISGWVIGFIIAAIMFFCCSTPTHQRMAFIYHRIVCKVQSKFQD
jgi:membrane-associated phospholipid phosphatase